MNLEMLVQQTVGGLRKQLRPWRQAGETIGLVPTMGNLHAGHLQLIRRAQQRCDRCVVSIFVNPIQFAAGEDFEGYPRTFEQDRQKLLGLQVDLLFAPKVQEVYPHGTEGHTRVEVPGLSDILCGASRPGHFGGVATVVCKLLNMVQPDLAVFGEKDFQQLLVIRQMVADLAMPVEILGEPTQREPSGLARSSRNGYLSAHELEIAPLLHQALRETVSAIQDGETDYAGLERKAVGHLQQAGFRPDYFSVRRARDLALPQPGDTGLVVMAAAYLGRARLIDNLPLTRIFHPGG